MGYIPIIAQQHRDLLTSLNPGPVIDSGNTAWMLTGNTETITTFVKMFRLL